MTIRKPRKFEIVAFAIFGFAFAASLVAGWHIHVDDLTSNQGHFREVYLEPWGAIDTVLLIVLGVLVGAAAFFLYWLIVERGAHRGPDTTPVPAKWIAIGAAVLFVCWLPYLLAYWPGLVFGDTMVSIKQHFSTLNNHHPVLYTLFIRGCLIIGRKLGDPTLGIALYCIIQMAVMSISLSYLVFWSRIRARLRAFWLVVFFALFGVVPYFASYSIALWKDPVFSCAIVVLSLLLADLVFTKGACAKRRTWIIGLVLCVLTAIFTRNNGIFVVGLCCVACLALMLKDRKRPDRKRGFRRAFIVLGVITVICALITGPFYKAMGWTGRSVESYGVLLGQMANVVVHDGDMSDSDREYLSEFKPLDKWEDYYTPRLIDPLKGSGGFGGQIGSELFGHWGSMLVRNPDLYLEAWVLQTYGFWTVNGPGIWDYVWNIMAGVPRSLDETRVQQLTNRGINPQNLLGNNDLRNVFSVYGYQPPVGVLLWIMVFLALVLGLSARKRWLIALLPAFGLMVTLLAASPIWYWPRYALAVQLLIPLLVALFGMVGCKRKGTGA